MTIKKLVQLNVRVSVRLKKEFDKALAQRGQVRERILEQLLNTYIKNGDEKIGM